MLRIIARQAHADVGDMLRAWATITDDTGLPATPDTITITITLPDGTQQTGTTTQEHVGLWSLTHTLTVPGEHTITVEVASTTIGDDVDAWIVWVDAVDTTRPTVADLITYLGDGSWTAEDIADALDAERAAQERCCTIPAHYPPDLAQALKRRVARNLAARSVPVASYTAFDGGGGTVQRLTRVDAEVQRLEAPYRRLVIA